MADWSDTPPTVDGTYWTKSRLNTIEIPAARADGIWWYIGEDWSEAGIVSKVQFGSRIPSNAELLAMRQQIAELTAQRDAAEAELESATQRLIDAEVA